MSRSLCLPLTRMHFWAVAAREYRALVAAQEHVLELVHPGVGEEQRGIAVRDQWRAGNDLMAVARKIVEERCAQFRRRHHLDDCHCGDRPQLRCSEACPLITRMLISLGLVRGRPSGHRDEACPRTASVAAAPAAPCPPSNPCRRSQPCESADRLRIAREGPIPQAPRHGVLDHLRFIHIVERR